MPDLEGDRGSPVAKIHPHRPRKSLMGIIGEPTPTLSLVSWSKLGSGSYAGSLEGRFREKTRPLLMI